MQRAQELRAAAIWLGRRAPLSQGTFIMAAIILILGFFLIYPILLILIQSLNVSREIFVGPPQWGLANWQTAFRHPDLLPSLWNSVMIWAAVTGISFPLAVGISWVLARTRIPFSHGLEFMFWVSYMMPNISTTIGWIMLLDPQVGMLNALLVRLPFIDQGPFNIFSVPGIVWAHLMANGVSVKVMLLTPAFRNMDATLEEAARVSGASNFRTMLRVLLPLMASPMVLVLALHFIRIFQTFEIEQLLGTPFGFFVYSTMIYSLVQREPPLYGEATVLASLTFLVIVVIIPLQRWIINRRRYTTISGAFKPGLVDLGRWRYPVLGMILFAITLLTVIPAVVMVLGSFMRRTGYFELSPMFTLGHWKLVLTDPLFLTGLQTTLTLAVTAAILSPLLFSILGYILVRTRWHGRTLLDFVIWGSAGIPGILTGLGLLMLFLTTPGLKFLYGTIWALLIVVVLQGKTTGTNISKGVIVQVGFDMEEAARVSGASWVRTYYRIWIPLLMPTLILLGTVNFILAAGTTSPIILLASRETITLSILALEMMDPVVGQWEAAGIVSLIIIAMTAGLAFVARRFGLQAGLQRERRVGGGM